MGEAKCPVCHILCTATPQAIIPWLAHENRDMSVSVEYNRKASVSYDTSSSNNKNLAWLNSLLGVLNPQIDYSQDVSNPSQSFDPVNFKSGATGNKDFNKNIYTPCTHLGFNELHTNRSNSQVDESQVPGTDLFALKRNLLEGSPVGALETDDHEKTAYSKEGSQSDSSSQSFDLLGDDESIDYTPCNDLLEQVVWENDNTEPRWEHNLSQVDETEVPGTDLAAVKRHLLERSVAKSCLKSNDHEMPTEPVAEDKQGSEEITSSCLSSYKREFIPQPSQPYNHSQTEEVLGTEVSFLDRERILTGGRSNQGWTTINNDELNCSTEQTEEIPGTHLSFLDRQRLLKAQIYAARRRDDCMDNPNSSNTPQYTNLDNGHTQEVPGTYHSSPVIQSVSTSKHEPSKSLMHCGEDHCSESPSRQETLVYTSEKAHETIPKYLDCSLPLSSPLHNKPHQLQITEEVSNGSPTVQHDEIKWDDSAESMDCRVLTQLSKTTNGKRRRITASPQLRLVGKKQSDDVDDVNKRMMSNLLSTPKDMAGEAPPTKKRRMTPSSVLSSDKSNKHGSRIPIQLGGNHLCIAYDVLDPTEANALEWMNKEGRCLVVSGVHSVPSNDERGSIPFPSVLVTHAIDTPGSNTTCIRTQNTLRAMALGAEVIAAKWLVDSQRAGAWLDSEPYTIRCEVDRYET